MSVLEKANRNLTDSPTGGWQLQVNLARKLASEGSISMKTTVKVCDWREMITILREREPRSRRTSAVESHCQAT
jgi:hypothetical protein